MILTFLCFARPGCFLEARSEISTDLVYYVYTVTYRCIYKATYLACISLLSLVSQPAPLLCACRLCSYSCRLRSRYPTCGTYKWHT